MEKGQGKRTDTLQTDNVFTHKGYIEREAAKSKSFRYRLSNGELSPPVIFANSLDAIPAADVVPVRRGRWVTKKDACGRDYTICSACETEIQWRDRRGLMLIVDMQNAPYCPNCGARMDGDGDV